MQTVADVVDEKVLSTSIGHFPLNEYRIDVDGVERKVLHVSTILSHGEESEYLLSNEERLPYGTMLWASSIALAHEIAGRDDILGASVLELGAGTGLPGIAAASRGADVVQTDRDKVALELARRSLNINGLHNVQQRMVDWTRWDDSRRGLEQLLALDETDADALMQLATLYLRTGRDDLARATFRQCQDLEGGAKWKWEIGRALARLDAPPAVAKAAA
jgi:predicted nicotinamide N-methyase